MKKLSKFLLIAGIMAITFIYAKGPGPTRPEPWHSPYMLTTQDTVIWPPTQPLSYQDFWKAWPEYNIYLRTYAYGIDTVIWPPTQTLTYADYYQSWILYNIYLRTSPSGSGGLKYAGNFSPVFDSHLSGDSLTFNCITEQPNLFYASNTSGAACPTMRHIFGKDLPATIDTNFSDSGLVANQIVYAENANRITSSPQLFFANSTTLEYSSTTPSLIVYGTSNSNANFYLEQNLGGYIFHAQLNASTFQMVGNTPVTTFSFKPAGADIMDLTSTTATVNGNVTLSTAGNGLRIKNGTNATIGTGTLVLGIDTVKTTAIANGGEVFLTSGALNSSTALGTMIVRTISVGAYFLVQSVNSSLTTQTGDLRTFNWIIINQP